VIAATTKFNMAGNREYVNFGSFSLDWNQLPHLKTIQQQERLYLVYKFGFTQNFKLNV